jgi:hypothetical protein
VVFDGVIDGRGGEDGVEAAAAGGGIVLGEDGLDDGLLRDGLAGLRRVVPLGLEVIDVEAQDVPVLDGVGDGVGVELLLEDSGDRNCFLDVLRSVYVLLVTFQFMNSTF